MPALFQSIGKCVCRGGGGRGGLIYICACVSCYFVTLYFLIFDRGTADAEIHVSSAEGLELSKIPSVKPGVV